MVTETGEDCVATICQEDGTVVAQVLASAVLETVDSQRYFVFPVGTSSKMYFGAALYTSEEAAAFRSITEKYKNQAAAPVPTRSSSNKQISGGDGSSGSQTFNRTPQVPVAVAKKSGSGGFTPTQKSASSTSLPSSTATPTAAAAKAPTTQTFFTGGDFRNIDIPSFGDEELLLFEKTVQLSYANVYRCALGPVTYVALLFGALLT